jgi:hypothetical protein
MMAAFTRLCKSRSAVLCGHHQGPTHLYRNTSTVRLTIRGGATACFACSPPLADDSGPGSQRDYLVQLGLTMVNCATFRSKYLFPPDSDFSLGSVFASSVFDRGIS